MSIKMLSLNEFKYIYSKVPRLCVDLVIKTRKGILLTKRAINPWKGVWHTPGGTVLLNETLKHAVKRVAKEEVNLDVSIKNILGTMEIFYNKKNYAKHTISIVILVRTKSGKILLDKQAKDWGMFKTLPKKMISNQKSFLKDKLKMS